MNVFSSFKSDIGTAHSILPRYKLSRKASKVYCNFPTSYLNPQSSICGNQKLPKTRHLVLRSGSCSVGRLTNAI